jgi:hypothetical protein
MKNLKEIIEYLKALDEWFEDYRKWYAQWKAKNETAAFDDGGGSNPPPPPPKPPGTGNP